MIEVWDAGTRAAAVRLTFPHPIEENESHPAFHVPQMGSFLPQVQQESLRQPHLLSYLNRNYGHELNFKASFLSKAPYFKKNHKYSFLAS